MITKNSVLKTQNLMNHKSLPFKLNPALVVSAFKHVGERSTAKSNCSVSLPSVGSKDFGKLVNNRIVDHLEKCGLFSDFRSSLSTADLLTVISDRIARAFNRSGAT